MKTKPFKTTNNGRPILPLFNSVKSKIKAKQITIFHLPTTQIDRV